MLRIRLAKYGFRHYKKDDIRLNGHLVKIYQNERYPYLLIFKTSHRETKDVYLEAKVNVGTLTSEEYSEIEGYDSLNRMNDCKRCDITDDLVSKWIEDIEAYYDRCMKTSIAKTKEKEGM